MVHLNSPGSLSAARKEKKKKKKSPLRIINGCGRLAVSTVASFLKATLSGSTRLRRKTLFSGSSWWDRAVAFWVPMISQGHDATRLLHMKRWVSQISFVHTSWLKAGWRQKVTGSQEQTADLKQQRGSKQPRLCWLLWFNGSVSYESVSLWMDLGRKSSWSSWFQKIWGCGRLFKLCHVSFFLCVTNAFVVDS